MSLREKQLGRAGKYIFVVGGGGGGGGGVCESVSLQFSERL